MGLSIFGLFFLLNNSVTAFVAFKEISAKTSVKLMYVIYSHPFEIPENDVYSFDCSVRNFYKNIFLVTKRDLFPERYTHVK